MRILLRAAFQNLAFTSSIKSITGFAEPRAREMAGRIRARILIKIPLK
jgi:hypothetical protein